MLIQTGNFGLDIGDGVFVILFNGHFQQIAAINHALVQVIDGFYNGFEVGTLAAQLLGTLRVVPYRGLTQLQLNFG
ncbi:hypothetical protein R50073_18840 [Maricurvus nonylphenolicus]